MNKVRAFGRLLFFVFGALFYVARYLIKVPFAGENLDRGIRLRKQFTKIFQYVLGVRLEVSGELPKDGGLLVCNHRSYMDPFLLLRDISAMPVGKIEVASWPVIGIAGRVSGAIFVDRKSTESRKKARKDIGKAITDGYFIINFPEGTTHDKEQTIDFKPGMFHDAAKEGMPIYPVALEYKNKGDAWFGKDTFIPHFIKCFGKKRTYVKIHYGKVIKGVNSDVLLQNAKEFIDRELLIMRKDWLV